MHWSDNVLLIVIDCHITNIIRLIEIILFILDDAKNTFFSINKPVLIYDLKMGFLRTGLYVLVIALIYQQIKKLVVDKLPQKGGGYAAPGWRKVADIFRRNTDKGLEPGGIFTVYYKGELVVQFWAGYADVEGKVPWNKEVLSLYCSVTKAVGAIVIQMLVDRGLMELSEPVVKYWPEFGQQGKDRITVEQLLSHQAGLAIIDEKFSFYDARDNPEKIGKVLAAQKPNWQVGKSFGYHGITMGLLMDQILRRVDPKHRSLSTFFQEDVAEPFDIDFYIGLPLAENYRAARVYDLDFLSFETIAAYSYWKLLYAYFFDKTSLFYKSLANFPEVIEDYMNNPYWREVPFVSITGFGTGGSMAKLMGILANGGVVDDQQLLSSSSIERLQHPLVNGTDVILLRNVAFGPGTMIKQAPHGGNIFGHSGAGGQVAFADPKLELGWSYLTNHHSVFALADWPKVNELERAMYECAEELQHKNKPD